jgi:fibronectin type 3 domain-containing protein
MKSIVKRSVKLLPLLFLVVLLLAWPSKSQTATNYFYVATSVDASGLESVFSNQVSVTTSSVASATHHTVTLTWIAPTGSDVAVGYNVYRSTTTGGPYTKLNSTLVTALTYNDVFTPPNPPTGLAAVSN